MFWFVPLAAFFAAAAATGGILTILRRRAILDHPNERSSHDVPTPRGGGLALLPVLIAAWIAVGLDFGAGLALLLAVALALLSWVDDLRGVPIGIRLAAQGLAVALGLFALPDAQSVFQGLLPPLLDRVLAGIVWLWFLNLFNFMDGIDGISGVEAAAIGAGLALVLWLGADSSRLASYGLALAAVAAGFLLWNWHPARIFLGDVGSVAIGFLLGWLLLALACTGLWAPALLLPLYYLADATLTLARRAYRGEKVWQAHRQHFYQQAARRFANHAAVSRWIAVANAALIALATLATWRPATAWPALISGAAIVALLLWYFADRHGRATNAG
jgi:UDP-N-acetylmuramyl pentapeptide phosphotransferase/UDP-N-acetylglucosamine-1-phosphate transferase